MNDKLWNRTTGRLALSFLAMLVIFAGILNGCGKRADSAENIELIVFAAASMTETLTELGDKYREQNPQVSITFNFDSSGTLKTQIEEGAPCDIFISAAKKQMDQLDSTADPEVNSSGNDLIDPKTRIDLLENKVALVVPTGNPAGILSYEDMKNGLESGSLFMAIGNADVPVGQYTLKIFDFMGIDEEMLSARGLLTYGSNVKEVTTQVSEGVVDCGIVYQTDAYSAGLTVVDEANEEMCGRVIYPAAVLKESQNKEAASEFLEFLTTQEAGNVFEQVGFTPIAPRE